MDQDSEILRAIELEKQRNKHSLRNAILAFLPFIIIMIFLAIKYNKFHPLKRQDAKSYQLER
ncbi:MAG: hypothetical protein H6622_05765 [Halobacteriovoraceae bacterium]|nr:hypothetical protein [Halobacteriovoraceae bacterium]